MIQQLPTGRLIQTHWLPVPQTVTPDMGKVVGGTFDPARDWMFARPQTVEEWHDVIGRYDRNAAEESCTIRGILGVNVEKLVVNRVTCHRVVPARVAPGHERRLLVHTHGGAYVLGHGEAGLAEASLVAHATQSPVLSVDYRMPPEDPYPAAVDDVVAVWREMLGSHDRRNTGMFGSSAGGGLTMATVLTLKERGLPLPAALFLGSPWAHIAKVADSQFANDHTDNLMVTYDGILALASALYANGLRLDDPHLSPLEGDLHGFPPSIILTGTRDLFLSLAALTHRKLRKSGVEADLHVLEAVSHIQFLAFGTQESEDALNEVARFFDRHLVQ